MDAEELRSIQAPLKDRYRTEPYVLAGDVYAHPAHPGRGSYLRPGQNRILGPNWQSSRTKQVVNRRKRCQSTLSSARFPPQEV